MKSAGYFAFLREVQDWASFGNFQQREKFAVAGVDSVCLSQYWKFCILGVHGGKKIDIIEIILTSKSIHPSRRRVSVYSNY